MSHKILNSIFFLPVIFFVGFMTSFGDFFIGKIKNKWILTGLIYSATFYTLCWLVYFLSFQTLVSHAARDIASLFIRNFDGWTINLAISCAIAYALWHFKIWGAGDAKLFICYASLIPATQYSRTYFHLYFSSFTLLLAIFIPVSIIISVKALNGLANKYLHREKPHTASPQNTPKISLYLIIGENIKILLGLLVSFFFFSTIGKEFQHQALQLISNQNLIVLFSLLFFSRITEFFKRNTSAMLFCFLILVLIELPNLATPQGMFLFFADLIQMLNRSFLIIMLFQFMRKVVTPHVEQAVQKNIPFAPWMFLGALITWFF